MKDARKHKLTPTSPNNHAMRATTRRKKTIWLSTGAAVAVAAGFGAFLFGPTDALATMTDRSHVTAIPALAPSDSDTFVIAPYSKDWWTKVALMTAPETGLSKLDPSTSGAVIDNVGYSRSQDHVARGIPMTGALRLFYAESPTEAEAAKLATWLRESNGYEGRRVFVNGNTVIVAPSWVETFTPPAGSMASVTGYSAQVTDESATMWRNVDQEIPALAGGTKSPRAAVMSTVMTKGFGFKAGTTWVGTSRGGDSWSGDFRSGGVDPANIDFKAAEDAVAGTQKVLASAHFSQETYEILSAGLSGMLTDSSFLAPGQSTRLGDAVPESVPVVKDAVITAVTDETRFNAAASGIAGSQENINTQAISANQHEMVISYGFNK